MNATNTIGRYEIIEELGRGAMGSVFKAHDPAVGRTVALKTIVSAALAGTQSEEYRTRFLREAHAAGSLAHPGIVPVFDVGEHDGMPYLVMEFVDGRTLADALKKGERFTLDRVCEVGGQIAEALGYAHRQGVIHRDIKPANILMTSREVYGAERPRITDFGIAKLTANEITTTGQLLGTPSFMPPEQFTGAPIDGRADLFSLGVILYSLATGEQPFPGETMTAVSYKVVHTVPVPPSKLNPGIPPLLEGVILKCLAKSPAERYQTGEELAQDLAAVRSNTGATVLRSTPPPQAELLDSEVTLAPTARSFPPQPAAMTTSNPQLAAGPATASAPATKSVRNLIAGLGKKRIGAIAVGLVALVAVAFMVQTWLGVRHRLQALQAPTPGPAAAPAKTAPPQATTLPPQQTAPVAPFEHPAERKTAQFKPVRSIAAKPAQTAPAGAVTHAAVVAKSASPPAAAAPPASTPAATPAFNPKTLDPKTNARLRVDLKHVPNGLSFTIVMNSKPYLHVIAGQKSALENLFVPPGIQEFSVLYQGAGQEKSTNIVSDEFKARKRHTLRIEMMGKVNGPALVQGALNGDAQLFLSLR